jgi:hypothetical protein
MNFSPLSKRAVIAENLLLKQQLIVFGRRPAPGGTGPSWLSFIGHTQDSLWSVDVFRCESIVLRRYIGCSWSWTSARVAWSASAYSAAPSPAPTCAACSTRRFMAGARRDISVRITIRGSKHTAGERKLVDFQAYDNAARSHASLEIYTPLTVVDKHTSPVPT